ncbi:hypothetical protein QJS66_05090 [Kocuria rhizophila]|nr:hypothetical protein QJS66_05090 [Kocuria rhizophila]
MDTPRGLLVPVVKNAGDLTWWAWRADRRAGASGLPEDGSISPGCADRPHVHHHEHRLVRCTVDTPIINQPAGLSWVRFHREAAHGGHGRGGQRHDRHPPTGATCR